MKFGLYLLDRELITERQLIQALQKQEESLPPFGQLAIEVGMLSVRDVFRVLRVQSDYAKEHFGETAVDMDLLTESQVAELLLMQSNRRARLADVLVSMGAIPREACNRQLEAYRQEKEAGIANRHVEVQRSITQPPVSAPSQQNALSRR